jgi:molybdopterin synthase sulfur carrier subunit
MARVFFTAHLRAVIDAPSVDADGRTVGEALDGVFGSYVRLKGYVLDEQGALRQHVCIFLDGTRLANDGALAAPVSTASEIYVMQALSGG